MSYTTKAHYPVVQPPQQWQAQSSYTWNPRTGQYIWNPPRSAMQPGLGSPEAAAVASGLYAALSVAGTVTGAYHGYRRNDSIGWAVAWGLLGGLFPYITIPISVAQGYGKRG